ncbi:MAG: DUF1176 domain-containing protein [Parcubacteria group bacterium]
MEEQINNQEHKIGIWPMIAGVVILIILIIVVAWLYNRDDGISTPTPSVSPEISNIEQTSFLFGNPYDATYADWVEVLNENDVPCEGMNDAYNPISIHESDNGILVTILCYSAAYNSEFIAVYSDEGGNFTVLSFPIPLDDGIWRNDEIVWGLRFNENNNILSTIMMGRGLGDCGESGEYILDETQSKVEILEYRRKPECDEYYGFWPIVYPDTEGYRYYNMDRNGSNSFLMLRSVHDSDQYIVELKGSGGSSEMAPADCYISARGEPYDDDTLRAKFDLANPLDEERILEMNYSYNEVEITRADTFGYCSLGTNFLGTYRYIEPPIYD